VTNMPSGLPDHAALAIADAMPHIVWLSGADGTFEWFNRAWYAYTGLSHETTLAMFGTAWANVVHAEDSSAVLNAWRESLRLGRPYDVEARLRGADGLSRWFIARAAPLRDESGTIVRWLGTCTDIDDRRRAEAQTRYLAEGSEVLSGSLDVHATLRELAKLAIPTIADWCVVLLTGTDGTLRPIAFAHEDPAEAARGEEMMRRYPPREDTIAVQVARTGKSRLVAQVPPEMVERAVHDDEQREQAARLDPRSMLTVALIGRSRIYGVMQFACGPSGRVLTAADMRMAETLAARAAAAIENATLYERLQFAALAGDVLSESLSVEGTMQRLIGLVVPRLADWAAIDIFDENGRTRIAAVVHADPARSALVEQLRGAYAARPEFEPIIAAALRSRAQVNAHIDPGVLASVTPPELLEVVMQLAPRSSITVPLRSRGRPLGALVAYWAETDRTYGDDDLPQFEELGRRAAVAIDNAQLYEREHQVASAFQRAALPVSLPRVAGIEFDGVYVPAKNEAQVGGDWYDALRLSDGRVVISLGDVSGSGLEAAVIMAAMRQIVRGVAHVYPDPATILDAADRTLKAEHPEGIVTAFVAVYDPIARTLAYAGAGHPPPFVRYADGRVEQLDVHGLPLGLRYRSEPDGRVVDIPDETLLVFYTDGLTESTRDPLEGERRVRAALERDTVALDDRPAQRTYDEVLHDGANDDVVILAMRVRASSKSVRRSWKFDALDGSSGHAARLGFVAELESGGVTPDDVFTSELIFGELLGNVARHAPGPIEIVMDWTLGSSPVLHVLDEGAGFVVVPRLPSDLLSERGRGLFLVWSLAEEFNVTKRTGPGSHARAVLPAHLGIRRAAALR